MGEEVTRLLIEKGTWMFRNGSMAMQRGVWDGGIKIVSLSTLLRFQPSGACMGWSL